MAAMAAVSELPADAEARRKAGEFVSDSRTQLPVQAMSISPFNPRDLVIGIVLSSNSSGEIMEGSVHLDSKTLKKILSALDCLSNINNNSSLNEEETCSQYENISDWEGYLVRFILIIADSNDERISKQIISSILIIHRHLSDDGLHWLFNEFLQYISVKIVRENHSRSTNLGSHTEIDLDDTTGWEHLEANMKGAQTLLISTLQRPNGSGLFLQFARQSVSEDCSSRTAVVWQLIIVQASQHINRYIRENTFVFLTTLFAEKALTRILLETPLEPPPRSQSQQSRTTLLSTLLHRLPAGLEDDWSQVRYAASQALQACLGNIWSVYNTENEREMILQTNNASSLLLPILCLNRFHAAPSIQTISHHIWMEYFSPMMLGRRLLMQNVSQTVTYYHKQMQTAKNHMVCEAACHAICELLIRMEYNVVEEFALSSLDVLLDCCLTDERWPVKDAACISSGRMLQRFPLPLPSDSTNSDSCRLTRFIRRFECHLQDCISSVRENAAVAYVQAMLSSNNDVNDFLMKAAVRYIDKYLLVGAEDVEEQQSIMQDGVPVQQQSRIQSFLPLAMLPKKPQTEATTGDYNNQNQQVLMMSSEVAGMGVDLNILRAMTNSNSGQTTTPDMATANAMRKGWGCCMDCVELRTAQPWELSHGALCLLREIVANKQPLLLFEKREQLMYILKKVNCRSVEKLHAAVYEQLPAMIKAANCEHKGELQEFVKQLCQQCIGQDLMLASTPPLSAQLLSSQQQKHGYTVRKAGNNAQRGRSSIEEKRKITAEQCLQTLVKDCELTVNWTELFVGAQQAFALNVIRKLEL